MPIRPFLTGQIFDPETTRIMGVAFEVAYTALRWPSVVRSKNLSKFLDCAFSLVDLLKEVSMADFQQRLRYYLVCPLGLIG